MNEMEYGKAFTYPQQDEKWLVKWLIMSFAPLIPVVGGFLTLGYSVEIARRVIKDETPTLPEWSDFGDFLKKGFMAFVVALVYVLPILIVAVCSALPQVALTSMDDGSGTMATIGGIIGACFGCLAAILGIAVGLLLPAALGKFAVSGEIGPALRVGEVFALVRAKPAVFLIVLLISSFAASILSSVGAILCGVGAFAGAGYAQLATAHLWGQAYRVASTETGAA
ncbi:MAG: DUF4013 domain-containing protein [Chloroflexi bacterium]|nr:DUF4013 domain-containing protein [Chloroflexota bacterium]